MIYYRCDLCGAEQDEAGVCRQAPSDTRPANRFPIKAANVVALALPNVTDLCVVCDESIWTVYEQVYEKARIEAGIAVVDKARSLQK